MGISLHAFGSLSTFIPNAAQHRGRARRVSVPEEGRGAGAVEGAEEEEPDEGHGRENQGRELKAAVAGELQEGKLSRRLACQNKGRQRALTQRSRVCVTEVVFVLQSGPFTFGLDLDF